MDTRRLKQTCTYAGRTWMGEHRATFRLLRLNRGLRPRLLGSETDVCIEGFPRSANSLAVHAFRLANPEARIAHHVHVPMQVVMAVELGVPCAVLIRDPLDAISSLLIMSEGALPTGIAIRTYESFYARVGELADEIVIAPFAAVIDDPSVVARQLNERFGTAFGALSPEDAKERATERIRRANLERDRPQTWWTIPTDAKDDLKPRILEQLRRDPRLARAREVHDSVLGDRGAA